MSTDYHIACFDCKEVGPIFASGSIGYGYKVWAATDTWGESDVQKWLGHRQAVGTHEGHDLRIVHEQTDLPWSEDSEKVSSNGA